MQAQCSICGNPVADQTRCARCQSEQRARLIIAGVIVIAIIGIGVIALLTYVALTPAPVSKAKPNAASTPSPAPAPAATPTIAPPATSDATPADIAALTRYSEVVQPQLAGAHDEMTQVALDIRQFLKAINATRDQRDTLKVLTAFRDQLQNHEERLTAISRSLTAISAPAALAREHTRLVSGINKYLAAVQGYITGVSARSFPQISASQKDLEAADQEIRLAAEDFQQSLRKLISAS